MVLIENPELFVSSGFFRLGFRFTNVMLSGQFFQASFGGFPDIVVRVIFDDIFK